MNNFKSYLDQIIRINHAGEYGAINIYKSQLKFTKDPEMIKILEHMLEQEMEHLKYFEEVIKSENIRPSLLLPFWKLSANFLGTITAIMGQKYSMLCTDAVEEVIDNHYEKQLTNLSDEEELKEKIMLFRQQELEHKQIASTHIENLNSFDIFMKNTIKLGCKIAIKIVKKI